MAALQKRLAAILITINLNFNHITEKPITAGFKIKTVHVNDNYLNLIVILDNCTAFFYIMAVLIYFYAGLFISLVEFLD